MTNIQRGRWAGLRLNNSHLIKNLSPYKLSRYGANLIRSGASIMTQAATESIKGGQSSPQTDIDIDDDNKVSSLVSHLGLNTDLPEFSAKKQKKTQPKPKQTKTKQSKPKQTKTKQIKPSPNKTKPNKTKVLQKQKTKSVKTKSVKFQPRNIFD